MVKCLFKIGRYTGDYGDCMSLVQNEGCLFPKQYTYYHELNVFNLYLHKEYFMVHIQCDVSFMEFYFSSIHR